jgi:hypothetical protein
MFFHMKVTQGSDYEATFSATDPETNLPLNLTTGYTVSGKVAKTPNNDETPLYSWPVGPTGLVKGNGSLTIKIPGSVSADWDFTNVYYGVKVVNDGNGGEVMGIRGPLSLTHTVE